MALWFVRPAQRLRLGSGSYPTPLHPSFPPTAHPPIHFLSRSPPALTGEAAPPPHQLSLKAKPARREEWAIKNICQHIAVRPVPRPGTQMEKGVGTESQEAKMTRH